MDYACLLVVLSAICTSSRVMCVGVVDAELFIFLLMCYIILQYTFDIIERYHQHILN